MPFSHPQSKHPGYIAMTIGTYKTGIHADVPMRDYVSDNLLTTPTISSSLANIIIDQSPLHARHHHPRFTPRDDEFSRVANFGSAVAAMVFGGQQIAIVDGTSYASKAAKEGRDIALANGQIPLLTEEYVRACEVSATAAEAIKLLGSDLLCEHTILFQHGSALCRSRPDAISADKRLLIDLKITGINARDCNRHFFSQGYDMQAAFMERAADSVDPDNVGKREIVYVFVEAEKPYGFSTLQMTEATMCIARRKMNAACNLWADCLARNEWPGYANSRQMSHRPSYDETGWLVREETDASIKTEIRV